MAGVSQVDAPASIPASAAWTLKRIDSVDTIIACWAWLMDSMKNPATAFGPEYHHPRPRSGDTYYFAIVAGRPVGLVYTKRPSATTVVFALGLFGIYQNRGFGRGLRDAVIHHCFSDPAVHKVECEIYSSNTHSIAALRAGHGRMTLEGVQRDSINVEGTFYDRQLLGITRPEYLETMT